MNTADESARSGTDVARLPLWSRIAGALFFVGTAMLFARLIWEETVWTWERGPQMVGFSLAHKSGVVLFVFPFLLIIWTVIVIVVTVWNLARKKRVSRTRWVALGMIISLFILGGLPEGYWQRAFISQMAASDMPAICCFMQHIEATSVLYNALCHMESR